MQMWSFSLETQKKTKVCVFYWDTLYMYTGWYWHYLLITSYSHVDEAILYHSLFHHSVDPPLDGARFLLQHPFSGTLCHWTSSHHPLWLFFVNALKHFYFVNRFLTFYCSFTVHAFVVSVIVFIWATLNNLRPLRSVNLVRRLVDV